MSNYVIFPYTIHNNSLLVIVSLSNWRVNNDTYYQVTVFFILNIIDYHIRLFTMSIFKHSRLIFSFFVFLSTILLSLLHVNSLSDVIIYLYLSVYRLQLLTNIISYFFLIIYYSSTIIKSCILKDSIGLIATLQ